MILHLPGFVFLRFNRGVDCLMFPHTAGCDQSAWDGQQHHPGEEDGLRGV